MNNQQPIYLRQPTFSGSQLQQKDENVERQLEYVEQLVGELEGDLKEKMEYNWKILYALDDIIYQRNTLYQILLDIESLSTKFEPSPIKHTLLNILGNTPPDF